MTIDGVNRALGMLVIGLLWLLGGSIAFGMALIGIFMWSGSNTAEAHASCEMRRIENHVDTGMVRQHRNACMASQGYRLSADCFVKDFDTAQCFTPDWVFWIDKV